MGQPSAAGFDIVDQQPNPQAFVQCLDIQHASAFKQFYKQLTLDLLDLQPGQCVLDVGCGAGQDVLTMAAAVDPGGQAVGVDCSRTMIDEAWQRNKRVNLALTFVQGDVHRLAFEDDCFDRCHADRTFQHLLEPRLALAEMIRVTKPGGMVLIIEPDHESRIFDSPFPDISRRFFDFRNSGLRQPGIAHQLYALFKEFGLTDVWVEPLIEVTTDYETIKPVARFEGGIRLAQQHGVVTQEEADKWLTHLEEAVRTGRFFHAFMYFITIGRKPA